MICAGFPNTLCRKMGGGPCGGGRDSPSTRQNYYAILPVQVLATELTAHRHVDG